MQQIIDKAAQIIRTRCANGNYAGQYCVVAQEELDGRLTASVITPAKAEGIAWVTFCTGLGANKSKRALRDDRASVCFAADDYNITLIGRIEVLTDEATKRENWYEGMEEHFSGPDDSNYCVLRFVTRAYNLLVDWNEARGEL